MTTDSSLSGSAVQPPLGRPGVATVSWPRRHPLLFSLAVVLFLQIVTLSVWSTAYETNDDPGMAMRAAGVSKLDAPSEYLFNTNVLIGHALKALYVVLPDVPWYGCYLLCLHYLAASVILFALLRTQFSITRLLLFLIYFTVVESSLLLNLQFTKAALMVGAAASLLLLSELKRSRGTRPTRRVLLACASLYLISGLVREKGLLLILGVSALPVALMLWKYRSAAALRRVLTAGALMAAAFALAHWYDVDYYTRDPGWEQFILHKKAKTRLIDFEQVYWSAATQRYFEQVQWSYNDFMMLRYRFYADPERYSLEKLRALSENFARQKSADRRVTSNHLLAVIARLNRLVLILCAACLLLGRFRRLDQLGVLCTAALLAGVFCYMTVYMKAPPIRVHFPLCAFVTLLAMLQADRPLSPGLSGGRIRRWAGPLLCVGLLLAATCCAYLQIRTNNRKHSLNQTRQLLLNSWLQEMNPRPDQLYLTWNPSLPTQWASPLQSQRAIYGSFKTAGIGVGLLSPITRNRLEEFEIRDIYTDIIDREDVFLIVALEPVRLLPLYAEYLREHYGLRVTLLPRYETPAFSVLSVQSAK